MGGGGAVAVWSAGALGSKTLGEGWWRSQCFFRIAPDMRRDMNIHRAIAIINTAARMGRKMPMNRRPFSGASVFGSTVVVIRTMGCRGR